MAVNVLRLTNELEPKCPWVILRPWASVFIATLSLAENSEDAKKIKLAAENPVDFWKMKQMKSLRELQRRPREELLGQVTGRNPKFEKRWPRFITFRPPCSFSRYRYSRLARIIGLDSLVYDNVNQVSNSGQAINKLLSLYLWDNWRLAVSTTRLTCTPLWISCWDLLFPWQPWELVPNRFYRLLPSAAKKQVKATCQGYVCSTDMACDSFIDFKIGDL